MDFRYDFTAIEILKLLGYTPPVGKENLIRAEQEKHLKLPSILFEFWSLAENCPLLSTADLWTTNLDSLYLLYEQIQEIIDEDKEYWDEGDYTDNEYFQFYKLPKNQWESLVPNLLLIGSDYGAGVVQFGIRLSDIRQADPPIYVNHECDSISDWRLWDKCLSDFLMEILCDALCCGEYHTADHALQKAGWTSHKLYSEDLSAWNLDTSAMLRWRSTYGADAICGCAYQEEAQILLAARLDKGNGDNFCGMKYTKGNK